MFTFISLYVRMMIFSNLNQFVLGQNIKEKVNFDNSENHDFSIELGFETNFVYNFKGKDNILENCSIENCLACDAAKACLVCQDGYENNGKICSFAMKNLRRIIECEEFQCRECDIKGTGCVKCNDGYFLSGTECVKCSENCSECYGINFCTKCNSGYENQNGQCHSTSSNSSNSSAKQIGFIVGITGASLLLVSFCAWVAIRYKKSHSSSSHRHGPSFNSLRANYLRNLNILITDEALENNRREIYQFTDVNGEKISDKYESLIITKDNFNKIIIEVKFNEKLKYYGEGICTICLENFEKNKKYRLTPCGHLFHYDCIYAWIIEEKKKKCPNDNFRFG